MSSRHRAYLGKAGQLVVMAELAVRGWNVAIPELDFGDDIILLDHATGDIRRVQVKTAHARPSTRGKTAKFKVGVMQLHTARAPDLLYVFVVRDHGHWERFLVMSRRELAREHRLHDLGSTCDRGLAILVSVDLDHAGRRASAVSPRSGTRDLSRYVSAWDLHFPDLLA